MVLGQSRNESILENMLGADNTLEKPQSRVEILLQNLLDSGAGAPRIVEVDGATPTIEAEANTVYKCGTLTSLTISDFPETGLFSVIFVSGATPTTITATGITFPDGFTVEANTRYEISVYDGFAVYASWEVS